MCAVATLLDPRFKRANFINPRYVLAAKNFIESEIPKTHQVSIEPILPSKSNPIWSFHDNMATQISHHILTQSEFEIAYRQWIESPLTQRDCDTLEYWKNREGLFKAISLQYAIIRATSVPCERLFSDAGNTITHKRSWLDKKRLKRILFLHGLSIEELKMF